MHKYKKYFSLDDIYIEKKQMHILFLLYMATKNVSVFSVPDCQGLLQTGIHLYIRTSYNILYTCVIMIKAINPLHHIHRGFGIRFRLKLHL